MSVYLRLTQYLSIEMESKAFPTFKSMAYMILTPSNTYDLGVGTQLIM